MIYGVILAGGSGTRMHTKEKKQYIKINNKPIFYYSIEKFLRIKQIDKILLVIPKTDKNCNVIKEFSNKYSKCLANNKIIIIIGGKERYDSVYNSLYFINANYGINSKDRILIHDAARPNFDINDIKLLIRKLNNYNAITLGIKINDTIKEINKSNLNVKSVKKTLDRTKYYLISTPQAFNLKLLYNAYIKFLKNRNKVIITDDLQIVEYFSNSKTYILDSYPLNYKITTKNDLNVLKYII